MAGGLRSEGERKVLEIEVRGNVHATGRDPGVALISTSGTTYKLEYVSTNYHKDDAGTVSEGETRFGFYAADPAAIGVATIMYGGSWRLLQPPPAVTLAP